MGKAIKIFNSAASLSLLTYQRSTDKSDQKSLRPFKNIIELN